ncbi:unnamed protein product, partial [Adineta ricciae]
MNYDDCQSVNSTLLIDPSTRFSLKKTTTRDHIRWKGRTSLFNASLRRFQSPFRRNTMTTFSPTSYPLFRHFYLMRNSFRYRRSQHLVRSNTITTDSFLSGRVEPRHVIFTLSITIISAFLLILMVYLDLVYLNDALSNVSQNRIITKHISLCAHYPK